MVMNIELPIEINFAFAPDLGQEVFMAETHILKYTDYLKTIAEQIGMEVRVYQVLHSEKNLDFDDNRLMDRHLPIYCIQVLDDNEVLGEFVYHHYSGELYKRFRDWIIHDILFYMKSKALYQEYDSKFPEKFSIRELARKI
jgi:hypothetical protein